MRVPGSRPDPATAGRLVDRLARAVRPGGTLAIIDAVPDHAAPDRRRYVALYAAGLLTRTASGGVHRFRDYARWLHDAGARDIRGHDCASFPTTLIRARVPVHPG